MKLFRNKQAALKIALLVALAANLSYDPIARTLGEANLSQTAPQGQTGQTAAGQQVATPAAGQAAAPAAPAAQQKTKEQIEQEERAKTEALNNAGSNAQKLAEVLEEFKKVAAENKALKEAASKPAAQTTSNKQVKEVAAAEVKRICDGRNTRRFVYQEIEENGEKRSQITAMEANCAACAAGPSYKLEGAWDLRKKEELETSLMAHLEKQLGCSEEDKKAKEELAKEAKELDEKVKRCEVKKVRGEKGKWDYVDFEDKEEELKCNVNRLAKLDTEQKFAKGEKKTALLSAMEKLVNDKIKGPLKTMLKSEDDYEAGADLADDVAESLRELGSSNDLNSKRVEKMVGMIQGFKAGGETVRRSREMKEEATSLRERMLSAREEARRNPNDLGALWALDRAIVDHQNLSQQIDYDIFYGPMSAMSAYKNQGFLSSSDFNDFSSPYQMLKKSMLEMLRATPGSGSVSRIYDIDPGYAIPNDVGSVRAAVERGMSRRGSMPTIPSTFPGHSNRTVEANNGINRVFSDVRSGAGARTSVPAGRRAFP